MEDINPELIKLIVELTGIEPNKIKRGVGIETMCGLASPETDLFYEAFLTKFGIKVPEGYSGNHISAEVWEGCNPAHIFKRWFSKEYRERTKYVDITMENLERMIVTRKWEVDRGK